MKTTIKDVAKEAGVSPSTVSRALHNNPRISEEVRLKVRRIASSMGFHPNQMARSLVSRKTRVIGIVFPEAMAESLGHPFYPQVLQGLGQAAAERRYYLLLGMGKPNSSVNETLRELVNSGYVSGLVSLAAEDRPKAEETDVPMVVIGHPNAADGYHYVDTDNVEAGRAATAYLVRHGHQRIAFLGYDKQYIVITDRRKGYEQALGEAGLAFRRDWVVPSPYMNNTTDQALLLSLFRQESPPTAVVCMDDAQAIGLTGSLKAIGLSVPEDVSIVSFNNTDAGQYHNPPLTSIDVNPYQLGVAAMGMILDLVKERETPLCQLVPFTLVERDSVIHRR